jgi:hypothetical protein
MTFVVAISAFAGQLVALMIREEAPAHRMTTAPTEHPADAADAMAKALRKALEGDKSR